MVSRRAPQSQAKRQNLFVHRVMVVSVGLFYFSYFPKWSATLHLLGVSSSCELIFPARKSTWRFLNRISVLLWAPPRLVPYRIWIPRTVPLVPCFPKCSYYGGFRGHHSIIMMQTFPLSAYMSGSKGRTGPPLPLPSPPPSRPHFIRPASTAPSISCTHEAKCLSPSVNINLLSHHDGQGHACSAGWKPDTWPFFGVDSRPP